MKELCFSAALSEKIAITFQMDHVLTAAQRSTSTRRWWEWLYKHCTRLNPPSPPKKKKTVQIYDRERERDRETSCCWGCVVLSSSNVTLKKPDLQSGDQCLLFKPVAITTYQTTRVFIKISPKHFAFVWSETMNRAGSWWFCVIKRTVCVK